MPDGDLVKTFRNSGGGDTPVQAGTKVNWDRDADAALDLVHRLRGNEQLPGRLAQTLPIPKDFSAAASLVPREKVGESVTCGPDSDKHAAQVRRYLDADVDEVYVQQVAPTWRVSSPRGRPCGRRKSCRSCGDAVVTAVGMWFETAHAGSRE
jgi:hypothetical protein